MKPNKKGTSSTNGKETETIPETDTLFSDLFQVSHQLRDAFEPVSPTEDFVSRVRNQLEANVDHARQVKVNYAKRQKRVRWAAYGLGGAAYAFGLAVVVIRTTRWLMGKRRASTDPDQE